ncbi:hypothetical protein B0H13DRAFT_1883132 [Mycena leptocephala]|nr:hypothetical protein B0H13DRAFT_1883132 [Mycena leptocephala]
MSRVRSALHRFVIWALWTFRMSAFATRQKHIRRLDLMGARDIRKGSERVQIVPRTIPIQGKTFWEFRSAWDTHDADVRLLRVDCDPWMSARLCRHRPERSGVDPDAARRQ